MPNDANHSGIIVSEGIPFILPLAAVTIAVLIAGYGWLAALFFLLTAFVTWFFRNPERSALENARQVIAPADGRIIRIDEVASDEHPGRSFLKISIFMNVFNVHVNRVPFSGEVLSVRYKPGKFLSANLDKASALNERNTVLIRTDGGEEIIAVQIAGLIARRIVCWIKEGMQVKKGDRFGLIRFGSRVEVYLPVDSKLLVKIGDKTRAGETPLGELI